MKNSFDEEVIYSGAHHGYVGIMLSQSKHYPDSLRITNDDGGAGVNARVTEKMARELITHLQRWVQARKQLETERKRKELKAKLEGVTARYADFSVPGIQRESVECFGAGNGVLANVNVRNLGTGRSRDWDQFVSDINAIDALEKERRSIAAELAALGAEALFNA